MTLLLVAVMTVRPIETIPPAGTGGSVGVGFAVAFAVGGPAGADDDGAACGDLQAAAQSSSKAIPIQMRFMIG